MEIKGWDYTTSSCKTIMNPVCYFLPDYDWISYININGYTNIPIIITDTGLYDGKYWIKIDKQPYTEWIIGFLPIVFKGYPINLGKIELLVPDLYKEINKPLQCVIDGCC